jgi:hypothetical protein
MLVTPEQIELAKTVASQVGGVKFVIEPLPQELNRK